MFSPCDSVVSLEQRKLLIEQISSILIVCKNYYNFQFFTFLGYMWQTKISGILELFP